MNYRKLAHRITINLLIGATMFIGFSFAINMTFAGNTRDFGTSIVRSTQLMCVRQKRGDIPKQVPDFACSAVQRVYDLMLKMEGGT